MTNEELKKKICKIIADNYLPKEMPERWEDYKLYRFARAADALIAEGLCDKNTLDERYQTLMAAGFVQMASLRLDLEKVLHRAEVAERALRNAAPRLKCRGGLGEGFCGVDKCDYYHCNNDEGCVKAHLQQAEKELAEEGKE